MKMNKKGFTLVELLAVIVIMGVLLAIAIPAVTKYIENSRKDVFVNTVNKYISLTEQAIESNKMYCNNNIVSSGSSGWLYFSTNKSDGLAYKNYKALMKSGGKSSWDDRDIKGKIYISNMQITNVEVSDSIKYISGVAGVFASDAIRTNSGPSYPFSSIPTSGTCEVR